MPRCKYNMGESREMSALRKSSIMNYQKIFMNHISFNSWKTDLDMKINFNEISHSILKL